MKAILATKKGMTIVMDQDGNVFPATVLEAGPCMVISHKNKDRDGYEAIQIGFMERNPKKLNKAQQGHFKASGQSVKKYLREIRVKNSANFPLGSKIDVSVFLEGEIVKVSGKSIGKGFQGNMKRNNFSGGPATHGSKFHRLPGSIGGHTFPARVWKGKPMHGQMGNKQITALNLKVLKVDVAQNLIFVKGSVPGHQEALLFVHNNAELPVAAQGVLVNG